MGQLRSADPFLTLFLWQWSLTVNEAVFYQTAEKKWPFWARRV